MQYNINTILSVLILIVASWEGCNANAAAAFGNYPAAVLLVLFFIFLFGHYRQYCSRVPGEEEAAHFPPSTLVRLNSVMPREVLRMLSVHKESITISRGRRGGYTVYSIGVSIAQQLRRKVQLGFSEEPRPSFYYTHPA